VKAEKELLELRKSLAQADAWRERLTQIERQLAEGYTAEGDELEAAPASEDTSTEHSSEVLVDTEVIPSNGAVE
jgi:hypothetical protein